MDFFNNSKWPGSRSPRFVSWAILTPDIVVKQLVLHDLEHERELFAELLLSFRHRLDAVVAAAGGHMDY